MHALMYNCFFYVTYITAGSRYIHGSGLFEFTGGYIMSKGHWDAETKGDKSRLTEIDRYQWLSNSTKGYHSCLNSISYLNDFDNHKRKLYETRFN